MVNDGGLTPLQRKRHQLLREEADLRRLARKVSLAQQKPSGPSQWLKDELSKQRKTIAITKALIIDLEAKEVNP